MQRRSLQLQQVDQIYQLHMVSSPAVRDWRSVLCGPAPLGSSYAPVGSFEFEEMQTLVRRGVSTHSLVERCQDDCTEEQLASRAADLDHWIAELHVANEQLIAYMQQHSLSAEQAIERAMAHVWGQGLHSFA